MITWQNGSKIYIRTYYFDPNKNDYTRGDGNSHYKQTSSSFDTQPSVAWSHSDEIMVVWQRPYHLKYQVYSANQLGKVDSGTIPGTSSSDSNPAISADKRQGSYTPYFDIAWIRNTSGGSVVKYIPLLMDGNNVVTSPSISNPMTIASGSAVRARGVSITSDNSGPWIAWEADFSGTWDPWYTEAAISRPYAPLINSLDHHVRSVSIKSTYDNAAKYLGWSQIFNQHGWNDYNKFVSTSNYNQIKYLDTDGWDVQLFEAPNANNMRLSSYYPASNPNYWEESNTLGSHLKRRNQQIGSKRGIVFTVDSIRMFYAFGNITINDTPVAFTTKGDLLDMTGIENYSEFLVDGREYSRKSSINDFEHVLVSMPFNVSPEMTIQFSEAFGCVGSLVDNQIF